MDGILKAVWSAAERGRPLLGSRGGQDVAGVNPGAGVTPVSYQPVDKQHCGQAGEKRDLLSRPRR